MIFKYKKYATGILRPVVPIDIIHKGQSVGYEVLIDSGADECIFDAQIADILRIPYTKGTKRSVSGITGVAKPYYVYPVTVSVGGWRYTIQAGFLSGMARLGYGVVGQRGFFDIFIVKFDLVKGHIELTQRRRN